MDDAGHVATNNDENVVYNEQPYYCSNLSQKKNLLQQIIDNVLRDLRIMPLHGTKNTKGV